VFYAGNGRLRHPDGKFTDWTASRWMQQLGMNRFFQLQDGIVTVRDSGIYYVYAQVCHYFCINVYSALPGL
jgi:eiger protein